MLYRSLLTLGFLASVTAASHSQVLPKVIEVGPGNFHVIKGVNVRNGNFAISYQTTDENPSGISLNRTYNSRSVFNGVFGLGWGSPLESKMSMKDGVLSVRQNGTGAVTSYSSNYARHNHQSLKDLRVGVRYKAYDGTFKGDNCLSKSTVFRYSDSEIIRLFGENCKSGEEYYDNDGSLVGITIKDLNPDAKLILRWDDEKELVKEVEDEKSKVTRFTYDRKGRLILQTFPNQIWQKFEYDNNNNMTVITYVDNSKQIMRYDGKDRVISLAPRMSKPFVFEYLEDYTNPKNSITRVTNPEGDVVVFKILN